MITPRSLTGGVVIARIFNEDFMWRLTQMPFYHIQSHIESTFIKMNYNQIGFVVFLLVA